MIVDCLCEKNIMGRRTYPFEAVSSNLELNMKQAPSFVAFRKAWNSKLHVNKISYVLLNFACVSCRALTDNSSQRVDEVCIVNVVLPLRPIACLSLDNNI